MLLLVLPGTCSRWTQHIVEKYQSSFKINLTDIGGIPWYPDMKASNFRIQILLVPGFIGASRFSCLHMLSGMYVFQALGGGLLIVYIE